MHRIELSRSRNNESLLVREFDGERFCGQVSYKCLQDALTFIRGFFHAVRNQNEHDDNGLSPG